MSGGVALIDYDHDGYPDIYFTNAQNVEMALAGKKAKSALYHNNHDGTFTDVTDKSGVGYPCWAMGAAVGDYNNDGWPDLLVTCFGGVVFYRNNGDGTFTDVTKQAGLGGDTAWATGASFGDYDGDGWADLFVAHYVDFHLDDLPTFGSRKTCQYHDVPVQCGPSGLKGFRDNLYHNNGDGTFTDVSKQAGVDDAQGFFGLTAVWSDLNGDGHPDLFVANDGEPNYLYENDGGGRFYECRLSGGSGGKRGWRRAGQHGGGARRLPAHWPLLDRDYSFQRRVCGSLSQRRRSEFHGCFPCFGNCAEHDFRMSGGGMRSLISITTAGRTFLW